MSALQQFSDDGAFPVSSSGVLSDGVCVNRKIFVEMLNFWKIVISCATKQSKYLKIIYYHCRFTVTNFMHQGTIFSEIYSDQNLSRRLV